MSTTIAVKAAKLTPKQLTYLQSKIAQLEGAARSAVYSRTPKVPADVKAAAKVCAAWETKTGIVTQDKRKAVEVAAGKARETLLFASSDEALEAVKALEAEYARGAG